MARAGAAATAAADRGGPMAAKPVATVAAAVATNGPRKVMAVFFVGGVSFMEIAALRFISESHDCENLHNVPTATK